MRRAFTLIELFVVISIIALLIAILLPALSRSKESARRIQCGSNQRQVIIAATAYATEGKGMLPELKRYDGNIMWMYEPAFEALALGDVDPSEVGTANDQVPERYLHLYCPNMLGQWKRVMNTSDGIAVRTGYLMMFGRRDQPNYEQVTTTTPIGLAWRSTLSIDRAEPTTILNGGATTGTGLEDEGLLMTDLNLRGAAYPSYIQAPHAARGFAEAPNSTGLTPEEIGGYGGNSAFLDGSVEWNPAGETRPHRGYQGGAGFLCWW